MNHRLMLLTWLLLLFVVACQDKPLEVTSTTYSDPFFGVTPTTTPQLLAPELLASPAEEYNGTFSADGTEFYYTTDIPENAFITFTRLQADNTWSAPQIASFSGYYSDFDPLFSPDGSKLFFSSSRPLPDNQNSKIWYVAKEGENWGEPQSVTLTGTTNNEFHSSITKGGDIFFNIWSTGNIFKASPVDTGYVVEELPASFNSNYRQGDPFISPDEDYLIFRGYREDSYGRGDLYISFKIDNTWTEPENLGEPINSTANEMCPMISPDGRLFIFASSRIVERVLPDPLDPITTVQDKFTSYNNGMMNIYYQSADFIAERRKKHEQ